MDTFLKPLTVYHINGRRTDDRPQLIDDCIAAIHIRRNEADLLRFYALKCGNGFSPAAAYISRETGLDPKTIRRSRELLEEDGLINVSPYYRILSVDWSRIRVLASIRYELADDGTPAGAAQRRNRSIAQAEGAKLRRPSYIEKLLSYPKDSAQYREGLDIWCYFNYTTGQLCQWLTSLSQDEYSSWCNSMHNFFARFPEQKNCPHTIYMEETFDPALKFEDLPLGPIQLPYPDSYQTINRDKDTARRLVCPEVTEVVEPALLDEEAYIEEGWIDTYELPF